jgi:hypothetical protein
MGSSHQLYTRVWATLRRFHPTLHAKRLATWTWVVVGLLHARSVHLSVVALHLASDAEAAGRIARIRRWLSNPWIDSQALYRPIIQHVLAAWRNREVTIMLDGCCVNHEKLQFFRIALSHCYRALPLAWQVVDHSGGVAVASCRPMLDQVQQLLIGTRRVTFLADRGFRDWEWAATCRTLGWDYIIRIANSTTIRWDHGPFIALDALGIQPGKPRYLANVQLTQRGNWRCNIAITWTRATKTCPAELCAVMTNREPTKWVLNHYLRRMHIEQSFRDDKSGGFDLDASHLRDPHRLDRLLLALAVATLWIYELGEQVLRDERRAQIDPGYQRQLSVFQLGWRWLRRALSLADLPEWRFCLHPFQPERVSAKC